MIQLDQAKTRAKAANKGALHVETEKDPVEQEVHRLHQLLQSKRPRTHATTVNDHEACDKKSSDDWDLADYRREATRIQNRRSQLLSALAQKFQLRRRARRARSSILDWGLWDGLLTGVLEIVLLMSKQRQNSGRRG